MNSLYSPVSEQKSAIFKSIVRDVCRSRGRGNCPPPQLLAAQLTLFDPGGGRFCPSYYLLLSTDPPPQTIGVSDYYFSDFRNFFNWTWTYRRDSDIIESYGPFIGKISDPPPVSSFSERKHPKGRLKST